MEEIDGSIMFWGLENTRDEILQDSLLKAIFEMSHIKCADKMNFTRLPNGEIRNYLEVDLEIN